ncbi:MAG: hypothetical protein Q9213_006725 [Squamulea squamosa]
MGLESSKTPSRAQEALATDASNLNNNNIDEWDYQVITREVHHFVACCYSAELRRQVVFAQPGVFFKIRRLSRGFTPKLRTSMPYRSIGRTGRFSLAIVGLIGGQLPILAHCEDLVRAMFYGSYLPPNNKVKTWGQGLHSDEMTESLPKVYWLAGRGPATCVLDLNADPRYPFAREAFTLRDVAIKGEHITTACLERRAQIGRDFLGETSKVVANIVRSDSPRVLRGIQREAVETYTIPGLGELLVASRGADNKSDGVRELKEKS